MIPLIFLAEKAYFRSASSSGSGLIVLGGGIALVVVLLLPLGKLAGPYLDDLRYTGDAVQVIVLFALWAGLLGFNLLRLHAPSREPVRGPFVSALLLLPMTGLAALWLVALGKAMLAYGAKTTEAWGGKAMLELVNGVYWIALLIAACMLFHLFPVLISKEPTRARH